MSRQLTADIGWKQDRQTGRGYRGAKIALYDSCQVQLLTAETNEEGMDFSHLTPGSIISAKWWRHRTISSAM